MDTHDRRICAVEFESSYTSVCPCGKSAQYVRGPRSDIVGVLVGIMDDLSMIATGTWDDVLYGEFKESAAMKLELARRALSGEERP